MFNNHPFGHHIMPHFTFGKRKCFAHKSSVSLPQGVIPPFHMSGFATFFADTVMGFLRKYFLISIPKIAETMTLAIVIRQLKVKLQASCPISFSIYKSNNLSGSPAKCCPKPSFVGFLKNETPQFIKFKNITCLCRLQRLFQGRQRLDFFLSM